MNLDIVLQAVILGLLQGGVYALIASGLTLIYGVMKFVNFAHGEFVTLGMYLAYFTFRQLGFDPYLGFLPILVIVPLWSIFVFKVAIRPSMSHPAINQTLITIGLSTLMIGFIQLFWGTNMQSVRPDHARLVFDVASLRISFPRLLAFCVATALSAGMWWFMKSTRTGMAIRAVSQNAEAAKLMAINVDRIQELTFAIGLVLASIAGLLISTSYSIFPTVGIDLFLLPAFVIVVLGTMGNFMGALIGALIIGLVESLGGLFLGSSLRQLASLSIFIIILLVMPKGLFGGKTR